MSFLNQLRPRVQAVQEQQAVRAWRVSEITACIERDELGHRFVAKPNFFS